MDMEGVLHFTFVGQKPVYKRRKQGLFESQHHKLVLVVEQKLQPTNRLDRTT
jgi:hypothetical protein